MLSDGAEFLTVADAAKLLKVSRVTVHRWLKQGLLRAYHVGPRAVRINRQDLRRIVVPTHVVPTHGEEITMRTELTPTATTFAAVRPPSEQEKRRALDALARARALGVAILTRRDGEPVAESWPIIQEARAERDEERG